MAAQIEKLSKDELKTRYENSLKRKQKDKQKDATRTQKGFGLVSGAGGGALASFTQNTLEDMMPEGFGDEAATYGVLGLLELVAIMDDGELGMQASYAAAGMAGYLAGNVVDTMLS